MASEEYRFDHIKHKSKSGLTLTHLDNMIKMVLDPTASTVKRVGAGLCIGAAWVFIGVRAKVKGELMEVEAQEYEISRHEQNERDLARDPAERKIFP